MLADMDLGIDDDSSNSSSSVVVPAAPPAPASRAPAKAAAVAVKETKHPERPKIAFQYQSQEVPAVPAALAATAAEKKAQRLAMAATKKKQATEGFIAKISETAGELLTLHRQLEPMKPVSLLDHQNILDISRCVVDIKRTLSEKKAKYNVCTDGEALRAWLFPKKQNASAAADDDGGATEQKQYTPIESQPTRPPGGFAIVISSNTEVLLDYLQTLLPFVYGMPIGVCDVWFVYDGMPFYKMERKEVSDLLSALKDKGKNQKNRFANQRLRMQLDALPKSQLGYWLELDGPFKADVEQAMAGEGLSSWQSKGGGSGGGGGKRRFAKGGSAPLAPTSMPPQSYLVEAMSANTWMRDGIAFRRTLSTLHTVLVCCMEARAVLSEGSRYLNEVIRRARSKAVPVGILHNPTAAPAAAEAKTSNPSTTTAAAAAAAARAEAGDEEFDAYEFDAYVPNDRLNYLQVVQANRKESRTMALATAADSMDTETIRSLASSGGGLTPSQFLTQPVITAGALTFVPGVSNYMAAAIVKVYPSMPDLWDAWSELEGYPELQAKMLQDIKYRAQFATIEQDLAEIDAAQGKGGGGGKKKRSVEGSDDDGDVSAKAAKFRRIGPAVSRKIWLAYGFRRNKEKARLNAFDAVDETKDKPVPRAKPKMVAVPAKPKAAAKPRLKPLAPKPAVDGAAASLETKEAKKGTKRKRLDDDASDAAGDGIDWNAEAAARKGGGIAAGSGGASRSASDDADVEIVVDETVVVKPPPKKKPKTK